ncbi:MAG TPA: flagellum-specific ATP synthase FliI, partial [Mesorhizobium sp.]
MTSDQSPMRVDERSADSEPTGPLPALERLWQRFQNDDLLLRQGGRITEVSATHYNARGLSGIARLGDLVEHRSHAGARSGEIVKIAREEVVVAPYERSADAGIGDAVFR